MMGGRKEAYTLGEKRGIQTNLVCEREGKEKSLSLREAPSYPLLLKTNLSSGGRGEGGRRENSFFLL